MKKYIFCLLLLFIPLNIFGLELDTYSSNVILYNLNEDSILYEKNSEDVVSIASLTKIMTGIVAIENINDLDEKVTLTYDDFKGLAEANASQAGFFVYEEVTYRDLLYGLLLPSGADAARALSRLIAGDEENYVKLMNDKAKELGLTNTSFKNTTGLDSEGHHSTVREVAKLLKYAADNSIFLEIIKQDNYTTSNNKHRFKNTILKMQELYNVHDMDYLIGGKTGTTGEAGLCLASIAEKDEVKYLLVTTGAPLSREAPYNLLDAKKIYEYFMENYSYKKIINKGEILIKIKSLYSKENEFVFKSSADVIRYLENDFDKEKIDYKYTGSDLITLDMSKGYKLGTIDVIYNNEVLYSQDIILDRKPTLDVIKYIKGHKIFNYIFLTIGFIFISLLLLFFRRKKKFR